jgi:hypothetical protein
MSERIATQPNSYRQGIVNRFAAQTKPGTTTFAESKAKNAERLREKQADLKAKIGKIIDSLDEIECDKWLDEMAKKPQKMGGSVVVLGWGHGK